VFYFHLSVCQTPTCEIIYHLAFFSVPELGDAD
jgi:hypothetical protein